MKWITITLLFTLCACGNSGDLKNINEVSNQEAVELMLKLETGKDSLYKNEVFVDMPHKTP